MDQVSSKCPLDLLGEDFFIVQILPRIDSAQSIVRLGMASKRFHSLCSLPSVLEFKWIPHEVGLIRYLDNLEARMRKKSNNIKHEFRRLLFCPQHNPELFLGWFHKALSLNVQEFILGINGPAAACHVYYIKLRPQLNLQYPINLQCPMIPLKHLRVLTLYGIPISLNHSFEDWISSCCVSLEELKLSGILVLPTKLRITSSSLRVFTFEGQFGELNVVSAPKLVTLHVTWCRHDWKDFIRRREPLHPSLEISDTPNLEDFLLVIRYSSYDSWRYGSSSSSSGDDIKFPSLKSATVLFDEKRYLSRDSISPDSLVRLLHDISQTRQLCLSNAIVQQISRDGIIHMATLFHKLDECHVRHIETGENFRPRWEKDDTIMSFLKSIPSLKTFKLTPESYLDLETVHGLLRSALVLNVQELDLNFCDLCTRDNCNEHLKVQCFYPLKHLRVLTLKHIPIGLNYSFGHWVSTCCVNLQELNLSHVFGIPYKLRIKSSSLRVFTIIGSHFTELHVSAPKLVTLHVEWSFLGPKTYITNLSLEVSEYSPNLEQFLLLNDTSLPLEYYNCFGDKTNFPSLKSATVIICGSGTNKNISLDSLKRLLLDISQTRKLRVSDTIIHKISSCNGIIHSANSIHTLEELHVRVDDEVNDAPSQTISFVKKVASLKTLKLTIDKKDSYDPLASKKFRESLVDNIVNLGFSMPAIFLNGYYKVKVVIGPGDDETLLLEYIIKNAPQRFKFIFFYQY